MNEAPLALVLGEGNGRLTSPIVARPGERVAVGYRIVNRTGKPIELSPSVVGLPPGWTVGVVRPIIVAAGDIAADSITVRVDHRNDHGPRAIGLRFADRTGATLASGSFTIDVAPTPHVDVRLEPRVAVGGRGHYDVVLQNDSDRDLIVRLDGLEHSGECTVGITPSVMQVARGTTERATVEVRGPRPLAGTITPRPIEITASDQTMESWSVDGQLRHTPWIPRWLIMTGVALLVVALWLLVVVTAIVVVQRDPIDEFDEPTSAVVHVELVGASSHRGMVR